MRVSHLTFATQALMLRRSSATESLLDNRAQDRVEARAKIAPTAMAFDIKLGGNSITVTLSDRTSGEVFRKLVYDRSGLQQAQSEVGIGQVLDIDV